MIRTREEIVKEIQGNQRLSEIYEDWNPRQKERFLDACTGVRGVKLLYDAFFKEIMNPEYAPERLSALKEEGYETIRPVRKRFSYQNIKNVYTIVLFEKSPESFHEFENIYLHHAEQIIELLEKYPKFRPMYEQVYEMCRSTERVMGMFSKELKELDDSTVEFMIDELQEMADKEKNRAEQAEARAWEAEKQAARAEEEKRQAIKKSEEVQKKYEELLRQQK